jgi:hypothetical protein
MAGNNSLLCAACLGLLATMALIVACSTEYWLVLSYLPDASSSNTLVQERRGLFSQVLETNELVTRYRYDVDEPNGWIFWTRIFEVIAVCVSGLATILCFMASCGSGGKIAEYVSWIFNCANAVGSISSMIFIIHLYAYKEMSRVTKPGQNVTYEDYVANVWNVSWSMITGCGALVFLGAAACVSKKGKYGRVY